ncbi:MAG TPA: UDP-N-acetyl-D-glucosamine dehydrogenase, partial [Elusimicrobia bacterium]|nr:UDP-N-acetyl-D-glucosamine dehydrogenase [Elusimicrobiota bacterium]
MKKLKVAVIGVGKLGQHHARILSKNTNVELTAVVDILPERAKKIASLYHTLSYTDYQKILGLVDAVTIATPTPTHYPISKDFISYSIHCLIEKPITDNLEDAEEILDLGKEKNVILQIGHIERFNPAVIAARKYIHEPKYIESRRLGPYDPRVSHIGVVLDLMIHDLDIVLSLVDSKIRELDALGTSVFSEHEDIANVRIKFENGCVADLSASRISLAPFRKIRI